MKKSYFERKGTTLTDEKSLEILNNGNYNGFNILKHEKLSDGTFKSIPFSSISKIEYKGQLYRVLTGHAGQIDGLMELNMSSEKCTNGSYGIYYEIAKSA